MGSTRKQKDEEVNPMNKNIKKLAVMTLAGLTLCGTAVAAPHGNAPEKRVCVLEGRLRSNGEAARQSPRRGGNPRPAPMHHHTPAPRAHGGGHGGHAGGWIALGAAATGGLVGGIIGACR